MDEVNNITKLISSLITILLITLMFSPCVNAQVQNGSNYININSVPDTHIVQLSNEDNYKAYQLGNNQLTVTYIILSTQVLSWR